MVSVMTLRLRPCSIVEAKDIVARYHRRRPVVQGGLWAVAVNDIWKDTVGVAIVGWPPRGYMRPDNAILCVLRVAVSPHARNACSMLLGASWKAVRALGGKALITYTDLDESGVSLIAAGWKVDGITSGKGTWGSKARQRPLAVLPGPKRRWIAPGSVLT